VDVLSLDGLTDVSLRARWRRRRRVLIPVIAALLALGAFLEWGPIGLGSGPLGGMGDSTGISWGPVPSRVPVAIASPIYSGNSSVVIDEIQLLGISRYPAPHVLAVEAMSYTDCGVDPVPVRTTAAGFVLTQGCGGRPLGRLYGRAVGNQNAPAVLAAFKLSPLRPGACWLMTRIVTHYHVGIRHYVASDPWVLAVCAGSVAKAGKIAHVAAGIVGP
jgi:hypothetical protein